MRIHGNEAIHKRAFCSQLGIGGLPEDGEGEMWRGDHGVTASLSTHGSRLHFTVDSPSYRGAIHGYGELNGAMVKFPALQEDQFESFVEAVRFMERVS